MLGCVFGPAYDANKNGVVDDSEQGPGFWIVGGCGGNKLRARLGDGTTRDISMSGNTWFRFVLNGSSCQSGARVRETLLKSH